VAYHLLVLVGGFLLVDGFLRGSTAEQDLGVGILIVGVATALAVLVWTATLARTRSSALPAPLAPTARSRICPRCGRSGQEGRTVCLQCGSALVWTVRAA
jgi:hypothetical protein